MDGAIPSAVELLVTAKLVKDLTVAIFVFGCTYVAVTTSPWNIFEMMLAAKKPVPVVAPDPVSGTIWPLTDHWKSDNAGTGFGAVPS
jgi:hypothetical protein